MFRLTVPEFPHETLPHKIKIGKIYRSKNRKRSAPVNILLLRSKAPSFYSQKHYHEDLNTSWYHFTPHQEVHYHWNATSFFRQFSIETAKSQIYPIRILTITNRHRLHPKYCYVLKKLTLYSWTKLKESPHCTYFLLNQETYVPQENLGITPDKALELKLIFHNASIPSYSKGIFPCNLFLNKLIILKKDFNPEKAGDKTPQGLLLHYTILTTFPS